MFYFLVYLPAQILVIDIPVISIILALSKEKSSMPTKNDATGVRGHAVWVMYFRGTISVTVTPFLELDSVIDLS